MAESEKAFDQAAATNLRQPLCDAMTKAIDKMYGEHLKEKDQLVMDMLKREVSRINVVLPLGEGLEKMLAMTKQYAQQLGVSKKFLGAIQEAEISIHAADSQANNEMKLFQDKVHPPRAQVNVSPSEPVSAEAAAPLPEASDTTQGEAVSAPNKASQENFLAYKKVVHELKNQGKVDEDKEHQEEIGLSKNGPDRGR